MDWKRALGVAVGTVLAFGTAGASPYRLSISASNVVASQNASAPTGSIRQLYLWLVCASTGVSALECEMSGSLAPLGFVTGPGIINAGTGTHLLLAITGCPHNAPALILGYWYVYDTGGSLCGGGSPPASIVDCDVDPSVFEPQIIGFASNGAPPCTTGTSDCIIVGGVSVEQGTWGRTKDLYRGR